MSNSNPSPVFSIASIISFVCAILSFFVGALPGLLLAIFAIVLGFFGVIISLSPSRRGGIMSTVAIFAGALAIVAALIKAVFFWII